MRIDGIPDDLNDLPLVKEAPDLTAIIKSAQSAQQMLGNSLRIPGDGASDADKQEFRTKLERVGLVPKDKFTDFVRPEKPEMYALTQPPTGAETVITQAEIDTLKKQAHELGLAPTQFENFAIREINNRLERAKATQQKYASVDAEIIAKHGEAALTSIKERALQAALKFGGKAYADKLAAEPDAHAIMALGEVGKLFQERGMGDLTPPIPRGVESREEAAIKLAEIARNKDHPFNQNRMTVGKAAYEAGASEVMRLRAIVEGVKLPKGDYLFEETG